MYREMKISCSRCSAKLTFPSWVVFDKEFCILSENRERRLNSRGNFARERGNFTENIEVVNAVQIIINAELGILAELLVVLHIAPGNGTAEYSELHIAAEDAGLETFKCGCESKHRRISAHLKSDHVQWRTEDSQGCRIFKAHLLVIPSETNDCRNIF